MPESNPESTSNFYSKFEGVHQSINQLKTNTGNITQPSMSANPLVVSLSNLLKPHEDEYELKKDLIGQVAKLIVDNKELDRKLDEAVKIIILACKENKELKEKINSHHKGQA